MWTYLLINLLSIAVPVAFSFHRRLRFVQTWYAFWPAALISGTIFIAWDTLFTSWGVWGFNPKYVIGVNWLGLPVEEWLFFICIPYACVFTYHCLKQLIARDYLGNHAAAITWILIGILFVAGLLSLPRLYTGVAFLSTAGFLLLHVLFFKSRYLGRFYFAFAILLLPFLLINGLLTGSFIDEQVVWYNNAELLGLRVFTIPVEDFIYGLLLILMNITIYETLISRFAKQADAAELSKAGFVDLSV